MIWQFHHKLNINCFAGVSADGLEQKLTEKSNHTLISSVKATAVSESRVSPMMSPSIKTWLSRTSPKTQVSSSQSQKVTQSSESMKKDEPSKVSIFKGNRLPCKRKLIDEDSEDSGSFERFTKRQRVQDSPIKVAELRSPRKLEIKPSPKKLDFSQSGILFYPKFFLSDCLMNVKINCALNIILKIWYANGCGDLFSFSKLVFLWIIQKVIN